MKRKVFLASILVVGMIFFFQGISVAGICSISGQPAGCVKTVDIADRAVTGIKIKKGTIQGPHIKTGTIRTGKLSDGAVTSAKLAEDIVLGIPTNSGSLRVEASSGADYLYASSNLYLGQSGSPSADVDLYIRDPFYATTENSLFFNASLADLILGSGTGATPGDAGDLILEKGRGANTILLKGFDTTTPYDEAAVYVGTTGTPGHIYVKDSTGGDGISLEGYYARAMFGYGTAATPGDAGEIYLKDASGVFRVYAYGSSGTMYLNSTALGLMSNTQTGNGFVKAWARINSRIL